MKKYFLLLILAALLPMVAHADESGKCGDNLTWTYYESTHSLVLTGSGDMYGYARNRDAPWNKYCNDIVSVSFPEGLTSIGSYAFRKCSGLTSLNIPNSLKSVGEEAFSDCSSLAAVYITDLEAWCNISFVSYNSNPLYYAHHLFINGEEVKELVIPSSLTAISSYAFIDCSDITSVIISNGVTTIDGCAFSGCSGLTSVTISNSVTSIGNGSFEGCSGLTAVCISDIAAWCNISFGDNSSNPLYYAHHLFINGEEVKELVIPSSVTSIGGYAFHGCSSLTSVTIPNNVTSIGQDSFSGCSSLTSVIIPNSVTSIGGGAFYGCSSLSSLTISNSLTAINGYVFAGCSSLPSVTIPNSVKSIGKEAFTSCSGLTSVTIPNSVTSIDNYAFYGCSSLMSVTIPNSVTAIGDDAFSRCSSMTSLTIGNSVTAIGGEAFSFCSSLTSVIIPNSVTSIGGGAFSQCSSLTSVTIPNSVTTIGYGSFSGCSRISSVYISDLSAWCKIKCDFSTSPIIPSNHHLYLNGVEVEQLTIPSDITSLENYTFYGCSYITSINIPNSVTSIGESAFSGCSRVTSLTLPDNLMMIKKQTFQNCSNLQKLVIPASVQYIYQEAFSGCNALTEVVAQSETPPFVYNDTFSNYNCTLKVPDAGKDAYLAHEIWSKFNKIQTLSGEDIETPKCATPTISYQNGKLVFSSATEGVTYRSTITDSDISSYTTAEVQLTATYNISVYATKSGYDNSDVATATLCWIDKEPVFDVTAVSQAPAQAVLIQSHDGVLTIQGLDDGTEVSVYGINGTEAGKAISRNGCATVNTNLQTGSVAIVKIGEKSVKVVIK